MNWLTEEQVQAAAQTEKGAIASSELHWTQILTATLDEVRDFDDDASDDSDHEDLASSRYCALCVRHREYDSEVKLLVCGKCPIGKCDGTDTVWRSARNAFLNYVKGKIDRDTFHKRAQPMLDLIRSLK